jgi:hypothetical protein
MCGHCGCENGMKATILDLQTGKETVLYRNDQSEHVHADGSRHSHAHDPSNHHGHGDRHIHGGQHGYMPHRRVRPLRRAEHRVTTFQLQRIFARKVSRVR